MSLVVAFLAALLSVVYQAGRPLPAAAQAALTEYRPSLRPAVLLSARTGQVAWTTLVYWVLLRGVLSILGYPS